MSELRVWILDSLTCTSCNKQGFTFCREPRRRVEGAAEYTQRGATAKMLDMRQGDRSHLPPDVRNWGKTTGGDTGSVIRQAPTLGWSDCGCGVPFAPGVTLDPFAGTGTTLAVADLHGRDAIGIDIDTRNPQLYEQRRAECARNLFDSPMPNAAQLDLFGAPA